MSNNLKNRLRFMFAGVVLLLVLFTVIILAVPFNGKFGLGYWVAFGGAYANFVAAIMFLLTPLNAVGYNNDSCANKVSLGAICMSVLGLALGIIFAAVNVEWWISVIVIASEFVVVLFVMFYFLLTSKEESQE